MEEAKLKLSNDQIILLTIMLRDLAFEIAELPWWAWKRRTSLNRMVEPIVDSVVHRKWTGRIPRATLRHTGYNAL